MSKLKTLVPPNGLGYQLGCTCSGVYMPDSDGPPPTLEGQYRCPVYGPNVQGNWDFTVLAVWSIL